LPAALAISPPLENMPVSSFRESRPESLITASALSPQGVAKAAIDSSGL